MAKDVLEDGILVVVDWLKRGERKIELDAFWLSKVFRKTFRNLGDW